MNRDHVDEKSFGCWFGKILTALKVVKLKEKRIQEELGRFPVDLTDGRTVRANNESQCSQSDTT